ncbi:MAG: amidohydrolase family protein [Armatimonadota bacterium]
MIDTNAHLGHWPFRKLQHSDAESFLRLMDGFAIAQAWVGAFEGVFYRDCAQANRDLLAQVAGHQDRLVPWAAINPAFPGWQDDLTEAIDGGMKGVRLYPNYHGYALLDECCMELLSALEERGVPVAVYHKLVDERLHHWRCPVPPTEMTLAPLLERFPKLKLIACGVGLLGLEAGRTVSGPSKGNLYVETSRIEGIAGVAALAEKIGSDRVLFGSHAPYFYLEAALLKMVESGLEETAQQAIMQGNAARIMA